jgi:hypothetical protein
MTGEGTPSLTENHSDDSAPYEVELGEKTYTVFCKARRYGAETSRRSD